MYLCTVVTVLILGYDDSFGHNKHKTCLSDLPFHI